MLGIRGKEEKGVQKLEALGKRAKFYLLKKYHCFAYG